MQIFSFSSDSEADIFKEDGDPEETLVFLATTASFVSESF